MENIEPSTNKNNEVPGTSGKNPFEETTSYKVGGMTFLVEPRFKESGTETIGTILVKLMKSES